MYSRYNCIDRIHEMTTELHKLHKQCGNKIVEFKNGRINGYTIISYSNGIQLKSNLDHEYGPFSSGDVFTEIEELKEDE